MNHLQSNVALSDLNLPSNKISDSGAMALATALRENSALTHLSLDDNLIGDAGAVALAEALEVISFSPFLYSIACFNQKVSTLFAVLLFL